MNLIKFAISENWQNFYVIESFFFLRIFKIPGMSKPLAIKN
jgi:hypothetical protein